MPTIGINRDALFKALGQNYSEEEFSNLCFDYGLELDEVTTERQMISKEQGEHKANANSSSFISEDIIYRVEIPANRYDLLCLEGLSRALLIFQGRLPIPHYQALKPEDSALQKLIVKPSTLGVRPFAVAAILRNMYFTPITYKSFIDLQDKLHQNICRKRSLVAIGTHDLDTVRGPFVYEAKSPQQIRFKPLNQTKEFTAVELMELYSTDSHLKPYLAIIRDKPLYPVISDQDGVVLSMPPIINGDHSKISLSTRNVFIECTATDLNKAKIVLDTIVCIFSEYCQKPFNVECVQVEVQSENCGGGGGDSIYASYPELPYREEIVSLDSINQGLGIDLNSCDVAALLSKMCLETEVLGGGRLSVSVPPTRHDVLHPCDVVEDVGVAYGFNSIPLVVPGTNTVASQLPINRLTDHLRNQLAQAGFTEALTFSLCSRYDISDGLRRSDGTKMAAHISNPKTTEFEVARTTLLPGLLKTLQANKKMALPLKLFEVSDVVLKDHLRDVGARNERQLCALHYNKSPGFEIIHGLLDRVMRLLRIQYRSSTKSDVPKTLPSSTLYPPSPNQNTVKNWAFYSLRPYQDPAFFSGRCAEVVVSTGNDDSLLPVGILGVLHPEVMTNFELHLPCAVLQINIEPFL